MKKRIILLAMSISILPISLRAESAIASIKSKQEFDELVETGLQPIAAQFHSGCAICNSTRRHLKDIKEAYSNVRFVEIDIREVPNLAERYSIAALPTVLIFEPGNKEPIHTITGPNREVLESKINEMLSKKKA